MLTFNKIQLIIAIFYESMAFEPISKHTGIGDYPNINMKTCGYLKPSEAPVDFSKKVGKQDNEPESRVIGGPLALNGEFPWAVSIHYRNKSFPNSFLCTGILINSYWVLTAKHCFQRQHIGLLDPKLVYVNLGSLDIYLSNLTLDIDDYLLNDNWDIALLKLRWEALPVQSQDDYYFINGICLPEDRKLNVEVEEAVVSGFGWDNINNNPINTKLRKMDLQIEPYTECLKLKFTLTHICALVTNQTICVGDSGGPLIQFVGIRAVVIGIALGGKTNDGSLCGPGVIYFHRVSYFIDWIKYWADPSSRPTPFPIETKSTTIQTTETQTISSETIEPENPTTVSAEPIPIESHSFNIFRLHSIIELNLIAFLLYILFV